MAASDTPPALQLDPPGAGPWTQDGVHFPRPMTRYWADMHPDPCLRGTRDFARGYGMLLDGLEYHVPKGYIYFAVVFSVAIEMLNIRLKRKAEPVQLHKRIE